MFVVKTFCPSGRAFKVRDASSNRSLDIGAVRSANCKLILSTTGSLPAGPESLLRQLPARAAPGIEPGTSRTRSENHATRPSSQFRLSILSHDSRRSCRHGRSLGWEGKGGGGLGGAEAQDEPRCRCFKDFHASLAFSVFVVVLKVLDIFISLFSLQTRFSHVSLFLLLHAFLELLLFALSGPQFFLAFRWLSQCF